MKHQNFSQSSLWLSFVEFFKNIFLFIKRGFSRFQEKYPKASEKIQLTFVYFFAMIDLVHSILSSVFSFEYFPDILEPFLFIIQFILQQPLFQIFSSPEKIFFLSYLVIELMVVKSVFGFSLLVRYNILLVFGLLMLQGLVISYWDLLFHRDIAEPITEWSFDALDSVDEDNDFLFTDDFIAVFFFLATFFLFFILYLFFYVNALRGKFATFSGIHWLTDSISFWLKIKTNTMPFGKKKKK
jgi:hypothetical protein